MSTNGIEISVRAWTPAVPFKLQDSIISSKYTNAKKFVASYERDRRPCIAQLLNNEYHRIWWKEKRLWDKSSINNSTQQTSKTSSTSRRRILLRGLVKKRPPALAVSCTTDLQPTTQTDPKAPKLKSAVFKEQNSEKTRKVARNYDLKMRTLECIGGKLVEKNTAKENNAAEENDVMKENNVASRKHPGIVECH